MDLPPGPAPYGSAFSHGHAPPGGAYGSAVYAPPAEPPARTAAGEGYGDAALEHLAMPGGRFSAWLYVVIAFLMEATLIGCALGLPVGYAVGHLAQSDDAFGIAAGAVGLPLGLAGAYFVFRDRWRCIERFSSRFCVGIMNISLMFVPFVAFVYANLRGIRKLGGT